MHTLEVINIVIAVLFTLCCAYQFVYIPVSWIKKEKPARPSGRVNSYAVLICARNEQEVIGDLISSIKSQTYPSELIRIFVIADNCDDGTAAAAASAGAVVYTRTNKELIGKGYALGELMDLIKRDCPDGFDGYFVFDADNILAGDYIEQMDRTFSDGHDIVTGYRNSKNFGSNWISAGYGLWFLRENRYLNYARYLLGVSCAVSGTGFLFSRKIAEELGGWPFHMLTEDIEFSADQIIKGRKIAFCTDAELYDEQPVSFIQSWKQRMRWSRGYLQVFRRYGARLLKGMLHGSFSCYDMSMSTLPIFVFTILSVVCNVVYGVNKAINSNDAMIAVAFIIQMIAGMYLGLLAIGAVTTVTEWRHIRASGLKKVLFTFTFPLFIFTYIPITVSAVFCKTKWEPIRHTMSMEKLEWKNSPTR